METTVLEAFKNKTGCDIQSFLTDFVGFCDTYYPILVSYYEGQQVETEDAFLRLDNLLKRASEIEPLFDLKASGMNTIEYWELLDQFTDAQTKLWTINNTSKWLRSAIIGRYSPVVAVDRVLGSKESFEQVVGSLGANNRDDDWFNLAKNNFVTEEDYDALEGGGIFKINIRQSGNSTVWNIVDNPDGKKILGKDINKSFKIKNGDLDTVEFDEAVLQAFDTNMHCLKGAIPEIPSYGITNEAIGVSHKALQYPIIFRNILEMFSLDSRFTELTLLDIWHKEDCVFLKIQAKVITNNSLVTNVEI